MYKKDLALNGLQWSICRKTKLKQTDIIMRKLLVLERRKENSIIV